MPSRWPTTPTPCAVLGGRSPTTDVRRNSNWRGPIWMPINLLLVQSWWPTTVSMATPWPWTTLGSDNQVSLRDDVAIGLSDRLTSIFLRDKDGNRAVFGPNDYFQTDEHWRDLVPFTSICGDTGRRLGAKSIDGLDGDRCDASAVRRRHETQLGHHS